MIGVMFGAYSANRVSQLLHASVVLVDNQLTRLNCTLSFEQVKHEETSVKWDEFRSSADFELTLINYLAGRIIIQYSEFTLPFVSHHNIVLLIFCLSPLCSSNHSTEIVQPADLSIRTMSYTVSVISANHSMAPRKSAPIPSPSSAPRVLLVFVVRLLVAAIALIATSLFVAAVSFTNKNFINIRGGGDWIDGLALAPVLLPSFHLFEQF